MVRHLECGRGCFLKQSQLPARSMPESFLGNRHFHSSPGRCHTAAWGLTEVNSGEHQPQASGRGGWDKRCLLHLADASFRRPPGSQPEPRPAVPGPAMMLSMNIYGWSCLHTLHKMPPTADLVLCVQREITAFGLNSPPSLGSSRGLI